jgi:GH24 family phage-related lysozyme (muramidase)
VNYKPSTELYDFIRKEEGLRLEPYPDAKTGRMAIGYGDIEGDTTKPITKEEAERRLMARVDEAAKKVRSRVTRNDLTQGQFDALVDMEYNIGFTKLERNGFWDAVNTETPQEIARRMSGYTKSRNAKTGELEELDALKSRVQKRLSLWGVAPSMTFTGEEAKTNMQDPFDRLMDGFQPPETDGTTDFDQAMDGFTPPDRTPTIPAQDRRAFELDTYAKTVTPEEAAASLEAKKLAKEGFDPEDALVLAKTGGVKQARIEAQIPTIAEYFPEIADWASSPENTQKLQEEPDVLKRTIMSSRPIGKRSVGRIAELAAIENMNMFRSAWAIAGVFTGQLSPNEAAQALQKAEDIRRKQDYSGFVKGSLEIGQASGAIAAPTTQALSGAAVLATWATNPALAVQTIRDNPGIIYDVMAETLKSGGDALVKVFNLASAVAENPDEASLMAASSMGTTAPGLAVGLVNPIAGAATAYAVNLPVSFSSYVQEQAAKRFTREDGSVDYAAAFKDPKFMSDMKKEASTYAGLMSGFEALGTFLAGANTLKATSKSMSIAKRVGQKIGAFGKDVVVQAAEEAAGEAVASTGAAAVGGRLDAKELGEIASKSAEEAFLGGLGGVAITAGQAGGRAALQAPKTFSEVKQKSAGLVAKLTKAREAINSADAVAATQEAMAESKAMQQDPDGMVDLINRTVKESTLVETLPEAPSDSELDIIMEGETDLEGFASITPSEWDAYHASKGTDPLQALQAFGPSVMEDYLTGKDLDVAFNVPVGDWTVFTAGDPEVGVIARINGEDLNAIEASEIMEQAESDPITLFDITAYHGSPYDFDRFTTEAIGTGEGAQAFGYGLYFTEDKDIAEYYRKALTARGEAYVKPDGSSLTDQEVLSAYFTPGNIVPSYSGMDKVLNFYPSTAQESWAVEVIAVNTDGSPKEGARSRVHYTPPSPELLAMVLPKMGFKKKKGQTYEVSIKTEKEKMLDWNSPLRMQEKQVRAALRKVMPISEDMLDEMTGRDFYEKLSKSLDKTVDDGWRSISPGSNPRGASRVLLQAGIPGIRYQAVQGRVGKENYVVFSDDDVEITKKLYNAQLPPSDENVQSDTSMGDTDLQPVPLQTRTNTDAIKRSIMTELGKSTFDTMVDPAMIEPVAEIEVRHLRLRAEATGRTVQEIYDDIKFSQGPENVRSYGYVNFTQNRFTGKRKLEVVFNPFTENSTVIHELAHTWLWGMAMDFEYLAAIPEGNRTPIQKEYAAAMDDAAELLDLPNIGDLLRAPDRKMKLAQETFAQTAERYFLDGQAENSVIKRTMERLRQFMTSVAKIILRRRQYPTLELSPKVRRLFETLIQANNKVEEAMAPLLPELGVPLEMLNADPKMAEKILEALELARSGPIAELYGKVYKRSIRERDAQMDKASDEIMDRATREIMEEPVMLVAEQMKSLVAEAKADGREIRVSFQSFMAALGSADENVAAEFRKSLPSYFVAGKKKGGVDIEYYVGALGLRTTDEFITLMQEVARADEKIMQRAKEIADKEFPIFKTDKEIHAEAVAAVNATSKKKLLTAELKWMMDKSPEALMQLAKRVATPATYNTRYTDAAMKATAVDTVMGTKAKRFRPMQFLRQSELQGRKAAQALKRGDFATALQHKYDQGVQFRAYRAAIDAAKMIKKSQKSVTELMRFDITAERDARRLDVGVVQAAQEFILSLSKNQPDLDPFTIEDFPGVNITEAELAPINSRLAQLQAKMSVTGAQNIDVATAILIGDTVERFMFAAKQAKIVELRGKQENIDSLVNQLITTVGILPAGVQPKAASLTDKYFMSTRSYRSIMTEILGSPEAYEASPAGKLGNWLADREAARAIRYDELGLKLKAAVKKAVTKDPSIMGPIKAIAGRFGGSEYGKPLHSEQMGVTFAKKTDFWKAILLWGSESGREKLILGGFLDSSGNPTGALGSYDPVLGELDDSKFTAFIQEQIDKGELTAAHFELFEAVWGVFSEIYPEYKAAIRKTDGRDVGEVRPREFSFRIGGESRSFKGGYIRVRRAKGEVESSGERLLNPDHVTYGSVNLTEDLDTGAANRRGKAAYPVDLSFEGILPDLAAELNVVYMREPLIAFGRVFANPEVRRTLEVRAPGIYASVIDPYFDRMKLQQYTTAPEDGWQALDAIAGWARRNSNMVTYFLSATSPLKQFTGLVPAAYADGPAALASGARQLTAQGNERVMEIARQYSPRALRRFQTGQKLAIRGYDKLEVQFDAFSRGQEIAEEVTFAAIQASQNMVDKIIFLGVYEANVEKLGPQAAADMAMNSVERTQGSYEPSAQNQLAYGSNIKKLYMMATNYPMTINNLLREEYGRSPDNVAKFKAVVGLATFVVTIPTLMAMGVDEGLEALLKEMFGEEDRRKSKRKQEEEATERMNRLAYRFGGDLVDTLFPALGRTAIGVVSAGTLGLGPIGSRTREVFTSIQGAKNMSNDVDLSARELNALLNTASFISGVPIFAGYARYLKYENMTMTEQQNRATLRQRRRQLRRARRNDR